MIFRNFINTLRFHKTASVLNILGLAIAFTAFYVIAAQVWYSVTYNSAIKDSDRIYIVSPDQQFAHRIPVPFWIFPAVLALILAITVSIVSMRSLRAARTNPAEALKKE